MSKWLRTTVPALVIVLALAVVAHATTWVFWVGAECQLTKQCNKCHVGILG